MTIRHNFQVWETPYGSEDAIKPNPSRMNTRVGSWERLIVCHHENSLKLFALLHPCAHFLCVILTRYNITRVAQKLLTFLGDLPPKKVSHFRPTRASTYSQDPHKGLVIFSDDPVGSTPYSAYNFGFFKIHQEILYVGKLAGFESLL